MVLPEAVHGLRDVRKQAVFEGVGLFSGMRGGERMTEQNRVVAFGVVVSLILNALGDMVTQSRVKLLEARIQALQVEKLSEGLKR
jgi:hypothetical protein